MRKTIENLEESKIRQVANAGMGRSDVLAFWFGESDEVTPDFIRDAAIDSLRRGETFYAHNLGMPELRTEISAYMSGLHGSIAVDRLAVTSGGVNALMLAIQALVDAGDEVVAVTPVWPNLTAQPAILGASVKCVSLKPVDGAWTLDLDALLAAVTPATRVLIINAPNNPTGWTLARAEQQAILDHCRKTGTWILADEVYERLYYEASPSGCAPSFLDIAAPEDRVVVVHSFSKSFLMTGWRLGWLVMPPGMTPQMGKLLRQCLHAACRHRRASAYGRGDAAGRGPPEILPRHADPAAAGRARRQRPAGQRRHVRLFPARRPPGFPGHGQAPGCRGRPRPGPRQCVCPASAGLAALVLRVQRPAKAGAGC